ncbi:hypothetical protein CUJ83_01755 [Methanocella sp. CWC-04]|uniref:Glycosyltransferase, GT2 family n=1 Tax=Methanooceanicella nereidis TaxID=2052831 RepID=A0AAP2RBT0_9EURY|nr:glycosyltransferase [Methanocella sp. CWC-04]MCD1293720.1 hypothetical protein [Methanocella sp. CWC-04]
MTAPEVSIVIPAGRTDIVNRCLDSLVKMDYKDFEAIVVVKQGLKYSYPDGRVTVVEQDGRGVSNARNCGISKARGKIIAFTDDDCVVSRMWLGSLLKAFDDPEVGGAGSIREAYNAEEPLASMWDFSYLTMGSLSDKYMYLSRRDIYLCTSSAAFRADIIKCIGGFDESLPSGEDYDLSRRVKESGFKLALVPEARIKHEHPATWEDMIRQQMWFARGDIGLARKYSKKGIRLRLLMSVPFYSLLSIPNALKIDGMKNKVVFPVFIFVKCGSRFLGSIV